MKKLFAAVAVFAIVLSVAPSCGKKETCPAYGRKKSSCPAYGSNFQIKPALKVATV